MGSKSESTVSRRDFLKRTAVAGAGVAAIAAGCAPKIAGKPRAAEPKPLNGIRKRISWSLERALQPWQPW